VALLTWHDQVVRPGVGPSVGGGGAVSARDSAFTAFALSAAPGLRRVAYLVCGDWHHADDLVQATLERMYARWPRLEHVDDPDAYARRVLTRLYLTENRRLWRHRETSWAEPGDAGAPVRADAGQVDDQVADRLQVRELLASLPPRQRAVVVLRYLEDRPVEQVAYLMDVSAGTVKRQCHDALRRLRARTGSDPGLRAAEERSAPSTPSAPSVGGV